MQQVEGNKLRGKHANLIMALVLVGITAFCGNELLTEETNIKHHLSIPLSSNVVLTGDYHIPQGSDSLLKAMKVTKADNEAGTDVPATEGSEPSSQQLSLRGSDPEEEVPKYGRVLLYFTSHFSTQHEMYLKYCWKNLLERSPLLKNAHVAVYLNPNDATRRKTAVDVFMDTFVHQDLKIYLRDPSSAMKGQEVSDNGLTEKRAGAHMAIHEAVENGYFEGYDWIIRVNPDVLLKDDSFFRETMSDPAISALFVHCNEAHSHPSIRESLHLHTDFFAVRPKVLDLESAPEEMVGNSAEITFTAWMRKTVFENDPSTPNVYNREPSNVKWIPGAHPVDGKTCRVGYGARPQDTPILHDHRVHLDMCTIPPSELQNVKKEFKRRVGFFSSE